MKIVNHLLFDDNGNQVAFKPTPNKKGPYTPQYLVIHYTAATSASGAINWLTDPTAKASAHLVIARDGKVTQLAPFNIVTWHAGKSTWKGLVGLNQFSIGIEIVNAGRLVKKDAKWICPVDGAEVPADQVVVAAHKNDGISAGWQTYTPQQIDVTQKIADLLVKTYALKDIIGHDDISPIRKSDPGPAFPMTSFRAHAFGTSSVNALKTSATVNIRAGAGASFATLAKPLPQGTVVNGLATNGDWTNVKIPGLYDGKTDLQGWISTKFLVKG
ncbi:hypothetical protein GCM10023149_14050 [Mucilaginibacter gynuensis]|uniref:N-acetylmuramoyl-L-alanine amidase n=1 Tax=Mucilaginibacter gynuensis TaxID=1302236 RepID=A0ABP8G3X2_9SPHI